MKLRVVLPRDTIAADDHAAVEVYYYVINGPSEVVFDNGPGFYSVRLQTLAGQDLRPIDTTAPVTSSMGPFQTRIALPARAVLGQVVNLRCVADAGGYLGDPIQASTCLGRYRLEERGSYRVIVEYAGPEFRLEQQQRKAGSGFDTAFLKEVPQGRHMADTAKFVVR